MSKPETIEEKTLRILGRVTNEDNSPAHMPINPDDIKGFNIMCAVIEYAILEEHDDARDLVTELIHMFNSGKRAKDDTDKTYFAVPEDKWLHGMNYVGKFIDMKMSEIEEHGND